MALPGAYLSERSRQPQVREEAEHLEDLEERIGLLERSIARTQAIADALVFVGFALLLAMVALVVVVTMQ